MEQDPAALPPNRKVNRFKTGRDGGDDNTASSSEQAKKEGEKKKKKRKLHFDSIVWWLFVERWIVGRLRQ